MPLHCYFRSLSVLATTGDGVRVMRCRGPGDVLTYYGEVGDKVGVAPRDPPDGTRKKASPPAGQEREGCPVVGPRARVGGVAARTARAGSPESLQNAIDAIRAGRGTREIVVRARKAVPASGVTAATPAAASPRCCPPDVRAPLHDQRRLGMALAQPVDRRSAQRKIPLASAVVGRTARRCASPSRWRPRRVDGGRRARRRGRDE
jgi:hypothetical protein